MSEVYKRFAIEGAMEGRFFGVSASLPKLSEERIKELEMSWSGDRERGSNEDAVAKAESQGMKAVGPAFQGVPEVKDFDQISREVHILKRDKPDIYIEAKKRAEKAMALRESRQIAVGGGLPPVSSRDIYSQAQQILSTNTLAGAGTMSMPGIRTGQTGVLLPTTRGSILKGTMTDVIGDRKFPPVAQPKKGDTDAPPDKNRRGFLSAALAAIAAVGAAGIAAVGINAISQSQEEPQTGASGGGLPNSSEPETVTPGAINPTSLPESKTPTPKIEVFTQAIEHGELKEDVTEEFYGSTLKGLRAGVNFPFVKSDGSTELRTYELSVLADEELGFYAPTGDVALIEDVLQKARIQVNLPEPVNKIKAVYIPLANYPKLDDENEIVESIPGIGKIVKYISKEDPTTVYIINYTHPKYWDDINEVPEDFIPFAFTYPIFNILGGLDEKIVAESKSVNDNSISSIVTDNRLFTTYGSSEKFRESIGKVLKVQPTDK